MTLDTLLRLAAVLGFAIRLMEQINRVTNVWSKKTFKWNLLIVLPDLTVMLGLGGLAFMPEGWFADKARHLNMETPTQLRVFGAVLLLICCVYVASRSSDYPPPASPALYARYCFEAAGAALTVSNAAVTMCAAAVALSCCLLAHCGCQSQVGEIPSTPTPV